MALEFTDELKAILKFAKESPHSLLVEALAGTGKCLGEGTPVLLHDGRVKLVEEVVAGDLLMGPDSEPRRVLSTSRGRGPLRRINPIKGESWVCNDVHMMTLQGTNYWRGQIRDVPLNELIAESEAREQRVDRNWKLWRTGVEFQEQPVPLDPYLTGVWLGDGSVGTPQITNADFEIIVYCEQIAPSLGVECVVTPTPRNNSNSIRFRLGPNDSVRRGIPKSEWESNPVLDAVRGFVNEAGYKFIPKSYLVNTRAVRLAILAGLADTDGYVATGQLEITTKSKALCDDLLFLARSLGFAAYSSFKRGTIKSIGFEGFYWRVTISGDLDLIPCLVARRQAEPRQQIKRVNVTGFDVEILEEGDYFGFTLDRDGRFLLGDFTVTHNTTALIEILKVMPQASAIVLAFNTRIAEEMARRKPALPRNRLVHVKTLHAAGLWLTSQHFPHVKLDKNESERLVDRSCGTKASLRVRGASLKLLRLVKDFQHARELDADFTFQLGTDMGCFDKLEGKETQDAVEITQRAYALGLNMAEREKIDFCDMGWLPLVLNLEPPHRYKAVLLDEAQDVNPNQLAMAEKLLAPGGRIIAAGDRNQAIYAWRGATPDETWKVLREAYKTTSLPLTVTWRCDEAIVKQANELVPALRARPGALRGNVDECPEEVFLNGIQDIDGSVFVLSRTNAELLRVALEMWKRRIIFNITQSPEVIWPLKDVIGKLIKNMSQNGERMAAFRQAISAWRITEMNKAEASGSSVYAERIEEQFKMLTYCSQYVRHPEEITKMLDNIFTQDDSIELVLSTVHKVKGEEADHVFLLRSTFARYQKDKNGVAVEASQEELNIEYVAVTRAKRSLTWVTKDAQ